MLHNYFEITIFFQKRAVVMYHSGDPSPESTQRHRQNCQTVCSSDGAPSNTLFYVAGGAQFPRVCMSSDINTFGNPTAKNIQSGEHTSSNPVSRPPRKHLMLAKVYNTPHNQNEKSENSSIPTRWLRSSLCS